MKFCFTFLSSASVAGSWRKWALLGCALPLSYLAGCSSSEPPPAPAPPPSTASAPPPSTPASEPSSDQVATDDGAGTEEEMPAEDSSGMAGMSGIMPSSLANQQSAPMMPTMSPGGMSMSGGGGSLAGTESIYEGGGMPNSMGGSGMGGMNGMGRPAIVDPAPDEDADYLTKAKYAFAIGKEAAAQQYVIAHMLANDAEAAGLLQQIRYCPGARRPAMVVRFAVGVEIKAPSTVTDYKPIGHTQFAQRPGGGGEMMGSMGGMGGQQGQTAQKTFVDYTGRFGEDLIKSFESAWDSGNFGSVFKDVDTIAPANRPNPGAGGGMSGMSMSGMSMGGMMESVGGGGMSNPSATPADAALRGKATPGKQIIPGLMFLGTGTKSELLGKAEAEDIDFLFFFDVDVENTRMGASNKTRLFLLTPHSDKPITATATLEALEVDRKMAKKGDNDEVAKNLTLLFKKIDATAKLVDVPAIKPAGAQARIKSLIEKKTKDPLPTLMEIKLFHSLGLLNDEERDAAYQLTVGGNGLALVNGTAEDRDFVLGPMLPGYK